MEEKLRRKGTKGWEEGGGGFIIFWPELPNIGEMSISRRRKPEGTDEVKIFPEGANGSW